MKNKLYSAALALCAMASLASCDLDEYNPKSLSGDEMLATYEGFYGLEAQVLRANLRTALHRIRLYEYG